MTENPEKPFAPSCERNKEPILAALQQHLRASDNQLLEVGSGTGQHAVFLAKHLPQLTWQTSEMSAQHAGIQMWLDEAALPNVNPPLALEVGLDAWPQGEHTVTLTINTVHIMAQDLVAQMINQLGDSAKIGHRFMVYGPFKYGGKFTTESNADFDAWLKQRGPNQGIREFEWLKNQLEIDGFELLADVDMPANNQFLVFEKKS